MRTQAQAQQSLSDKIYFDNFEVLDEHLFLIAQQSGEILAQIYNSKEGIVEQNLIKSGKGPYELEFVGGISYNKQTKKLYVADIQNGKIISFDDQWNPLNEKKLGITYARKLDAFRQHLLLTPGTIITEGTPNMNRFPIAYFLDSLELVVTDTLYFDLGKLKLQEIKDYGKTTSFDLRPLVVSSSYEGLYLVVFESFNKIFLIDRNSELLDEIELDINGIETPKIVRHSSFGYGLRTYTVLNDFIRRGDSIYFSFEQVSEETQSGLIKVNVSEHNKLSTQKYQISTKLYPTDPFRPFQVTSNGDSIFGSDGIDIYTLEFE